MAKKKSKPTTPPGLDLRNLKAYEMAASGHTQAEIGEELGISRQRVSMIMNSEDAQKFVSAARTNLIQLLSKAARATEYALDNYIEDPKTALSAAQMVFKGLGVLTEKTEVSVVRPFIMRLLNGEEIHMGHKPDKKGD